MDMNIKILLPVALFTCLLNSGCDNNLEDCAESSSEPILVFGHFYGECFGERCVETFKLSDTKLFEDKIDNYGGGVAFDFEERSEDLFDLVVDLRSAMPEQLLDEEDQTFGCPDCGDQGGIFIRWIDGDSTQSWLVDTSPRNVPDYLHEYIVLIQEKISLIST